MIRSKLLFVSCLLGLTSLMAQESLSLRIYHRLNDNAFAYETEAKNNMDQQFTLHRLEYYMSDIEIIHDSGQVTAIEDTWLLIDPGKEEVSTFDLGEVDFTDFNGIRFSIGVNPEVNHLDPASYEADHPLAPKSPSMHWGWASGYRFVAMEGMSGSDFQNLFEIHALGDDNYFDKLFFMDPIPENGKLILPLVADYTKALNDIDISSGMTLHSETGDAVTFLENFSDNVFSSELNGIGIEEELENAHIQIYPSPSTDGYVTIKDHSEKLAQLEVYDSTGRLILQQSTHTGTINIQINQKGLFTYLLKDREGNRIGLQRKLIL